MQRRFVAVARELYATVRCIYRCASGIPIVGTCSALALEPGPEFRGENRHYAEVEQKSRAACAGATCGPPSRHAGWAERTTSLGAVNERRRNVTVLYGRDFSSETVHSPLA